MKKIIFTVFIILSTVNVYTQEMLLSGGFDFGGGVFSFNNDSWFKSGSQLFYFKENTSSVFFAPGISFTLRLFLDDNTTSRGFVFRDRVIFITNGKEYGTFNMNGTPETISETYSISDDSFTSIMDFGLGQSIRFKISDKIQFYTDLGVNLTWMDIEDFEKSNSIILNYLGAGVFSDIAFQINFTSKVYLELGLNSIINIFSSQNGKIQMYNIKAEYEDTGRWDLITVTLYIHIGWRLNIRELESNLSK